VPHDDALRLAAIHLHLLRMPRSVASGPPAEPYAGRLPCLDRQAGADATVGALSGHPRITSAERDDEVSTKRVIATFE
jgi:hypothetical protein